MSESALICKCRLRTHNSCCVVDWNFCLLQGLLLLLSSLFLFLLEATSPAEGILGLGESKHGRGAILFPQNAQPFR